MTDDIAERERQKYEKVWQHAEYRKISPVEKEMERAWSTMGMDRGESLIDFGAGTGRATKWFDVMGLNAVAVDNVYHAIEEPDVPFVQACLWDLSEDLPRADYGFCCDVMEHIPPEKVLVTLASIAYKTHKGVWFRIATRPDVFGPKILGEPLHLTIKPGSWWFRHLRRHWMNVDMIEIAAGYVVFHAFN